MSYEFIICLILLFSLSAIGTPIAYAIFVGSCAYLWVGGQGIGLAGKVILDNPKNVEAYKSGKDKLFGFFVGQVMKQSNGKANPQLVNEILKKKLS